MYLNSKEQIIAPSGFQFPFFPYTEDTFVRIKDRTRYKGDFLASYNRETYDQEDFDHDLEPYMLEIEVQDFFSSLRHKNLQKTDIDYLPKGLDKLYEDTHYHLDEDGEWCVPMTKAIHKQLLEIELLKELPDTTENKELFFFFKTAKELKEICQKQNLKHSGSKAVLISRILEHGKPKPKPILTISEKFLPVIELIADEYIESIEKQLTNKPPEYHEAVWEQVSEEHGLGYQLPKNAINTVNKLYSDSRKYAG